MPLRRRARYGLIVVLTPLWDRVNQWELTVKSQHTHTTQNYRKPDKQSLLLKLVILQTYLKKSWMNTTVLINMATMFNYTSIIKFDLDEWRLIILIDIRLRSISKEFDLINIILDIIQCKSFMWNKRTNFLWHEQILCNWNEWFEISGLKPYSYDFLEVYTTISNRILIIHLSTKTYPVTFW